MTKQKQAQIMPVQDHKVQVVCILYFSIPLSRILWQGVFQTTNVRINKTGISHSVDTCKSSVYFISD